MAKTKVYEEVIAAILVELDTQHATYQDLYAKFYGDVDGDVKHTHEMLVSLCKRIRREIALRERP